MFTLKGKYSTADVMADSGDDESINQIQHMLNSPAITNPVRIMPDFHAGKGSVVGFTMQAGEFVIPNIVGVDIGCGMLTAQIDDPNMELEDIDTAVRSAVPTGFSILEKSEYKLDPAEVHYCNLSGMDKDRCSRSIGTLGGGNHFIEFGRDDGGNLWVTIHTGSRNFGKVLAEYYQRVAVDYSKRFGDVEKGLEFMPTQQYMEGMLTAQDYAFHNRLDILYRIKKVLGVKDHALIMSTHNFIDFDDFIRKGATNARLGEDIILPFNRREGIWIMEGLGNPDWNFSAPHGAGRIMSRGEAKRTLDAEKVSREMREAGVYSSFDPLDEAPDAYKSPDEIRKYINETAIFKFAIRPILNIKG